MKNAYLIVFLFILCCSVELNSQVNIFGLTVETLPAIKYNVNQNDPDTTTVIKLPGITTLLPGTTTLYMHVRVWEIAGNDTIEIWISDLGQVPLDTTIFFQKVPLKYINNSLSFGVTHYSYRYIVSNDPSAIDVVYREEGETKQVSITSPTTINSFEENVLFNIYPTLSSGEFTTETTKSGVLSIFNLNGQMIQKIEVLKGKIQVKIPDFSSGLHLARFVSENQYSTVIKLFLLK